MRLISEQNGLTMDQLARFFGIYLADMARFVEAMRRERWVEVKPLVKGDHPWVWLRGPGARHADLGFRPVKPSLTTIGHWHAINEARLYLMEHAPGGDWICERTLRRLRGKGKGKRKPKLHIADAIFKIEGEVHAIEVELSRKPAEILEAIVAQHCEYYDAVVYFCAPKTYHDIKRLELEDRYPRLFTCCLVPDLRQLPEEGFRVEADRRHRGRRAAREPEVWEVRIIDLLVEMGGIPLDLLARYLDRDAAATEAMVAPLLEAGFIKRAQPEEEGADWIWLGTRGIKYATVEAGPAAPSLAGLPNLRALSEVRLQIMARTKGRMEWTSGRVLRHQHGVKGSLPHAVVLEERGKGSKAKRERHAIDVRLTLTPDLGKLYGRYKQRAAKYDWVVWYCAPQARRSAQQLQKEFKCPKLVVRTIPGYRPPRGTRRRRKPASPPPVFYRVSPDDVEPEAFQVVALAANREEAIRILSVERRKGIPLKEYRIGTDDGTWRVTWGQYGWKATEVLV